MIRIGTNQQKLLVDLAHGSPSQLEVEVAIDSLDHTGRLCAFPQLVLSYKSNQVLDIPAGPWKLILFLVREKDLLGQGSAR